MFITDSYRAEQAALHAKGNYGTAALQYGDVVLQLLMSTGARSLLDYGCGSKRSLLQALQLPQEAVYEGYDPAIPDYAGEPLPAELVCCIDVLEHIEPALLDNVLDHLGALCDPYGFFTVHSGPAVKMLSDGRNAHLTQQGPNWWLPRLQQRFDVLQLHSIQNGFLVVVRSLKSEEHLPAPAPLRLFVTSASTVGAKAAQNSDTTSVARQGSDVSGVDQNAKGLASLQPDRAFNIGLPRQHRSRAVLNRVLDRVHRAEVIADPFPYLVVDDVFPPDYYAEMLEQFPRAGSLRPIGETGRVSIDTYRERSVVLFTDAEFSRMTIEQQRFWREFANWMYSEQFLYGFVQKFSDALEPRFTKILASDPALKARGDALLVNDQTNYAIGPHTDAPHRLISFLFYLPADDSMRELGTSIYRPKDPNFVCWGGPHHPFDRFDRTATVEFLPNRLLAFPKTERSFHGVEQIRRQSVNRQLLINNVRLLNSVTH